jgi:hypothetical protein
MPSRESAPEDRKCLMRHDLAILVGYLAASLAAGLIYSMVFLLGYGGGANIILPGSVGFGFLVAIFAMLPSILGIIYAERTNARSVLFYASGGVLVGWISCGLYLLPFILGPRAANGLFGYGNDAEPVPVLLRMNLFFGGPGLVGGLLYWLVAGRNAGR